MIGDITSAIVALFIFCFCMGMVAVIGTLYEKGDD